MNHNFITLQSIKSENNMCGAQPALNLCIMFACFVIIHIFLEAAQL